MIRSLVVEQRARRRGKWLADCTGPAADTDMLAVRAGIRSSSDPKPFDVGFQCRRLKFSPLWSEWHLTQSAPGGPERGKWRAVPCYAPIRPQFRDGIEHSEMLAI